MEWIKNIYKQVLEGYNISKEEAYKLIDYDVEVLRNYAKSIREQLCGNVFDLCSIINGKSGACSENCKYCAQSAHYSTRVETYPLLDAEVFIKDAKEHKAEGVLRYSIVTSGKRLSKKEVEDVAKIYKRMREECEIKLCASHGLLDEEDFTKLKEAGIVRYHNNLETSRNYFASICTTHTYEDKIKTIKVAQRVGLEVCSGGLFGLGETMEDRIDMAFELREMGVTSIPVNVLVPIPGTPMEKEVVVLFVLYKLQKKRSFY